MQKKNNQIYYSFVFGKDIVRGTARVCINYARYLHCCSRQSTIRAAIKKQELVICQLFHPLDKYCDWR
jgi:hypothetical protein